MTLSRSSAPGRESTYCRSRESWSGSHSATAPLTRGTCRQRALPWFKISRSQRSSRKRTSTSHAGISNVGGGAYGGGSCVYGETYTNDGVDYGVWYCRGDSAPVITVTNLWGLFAPAAEFGERPVVPEDVGFARRAAYG